MVEVRSWRGVIKKLECISCCVLVISAWWRSGLKRSNHSPFFGRWVWEERKKLMGVPFFFLFYHCKSV